MADMTDSMRVTLIREALRAREYSFSPISGFAVGCRRWERMGRFIADATLSARG
ncbi:MAG: hypothetical protein ACLTC4_04775 [Hungatella hathewayi]